MFADDALRSTFGAWLKGSPQQGSIFVDCSTVYPGTAKSLAAEAAKTGMPLTISVRPQPVQSPHSTT